MPPDRKRVRTGLSGERDKAGIKRLKGENVSDPCLSCTQQLTDLML